MKNTDTEVLSLLKMVHENGNIMCTDGLFHVFDSKHNELYINKLTSEIDKRGVYRTLVVLDNIVVSKVINNSKVSFVVLDKTNLKCLYKTNGNMHYIDDNIVCDKNDNSCVVISHTGKILCTFKSALALKNIYGNNYLLNVAEVYNDKILYYNPKADELTDLTEDSNYIIHVSSKTESEVEVTSMIGGKYTYNFKDRILINDFTGKEEKAFRLWRSI